MNRIIRWLVAALFALLLHACSLGNVVRGIDRVPIPGGSYSWGVDQKAEDFIDVEIAQSNLNMYTTNRRYWHRIVPTKLATASAGTLRAYYPMQVRWRLKDGREFVLDSVDTEALVREYFKTHPMLRPQWEREGRRFTVGDAEPMLAYYIKGDAVYLKWLIEINRIPTKERLAPDGAARPWQFDIETYPIATIKGVAASGIDFAKTYDPSR